MLKPSAPSVNGPMFQLLTIIIGTILFVTVFFQLTSIQPISQPVKKITTSTLSLFRDSQSAVVAAKPTRPIAVVMFCSDPLKPIYNASIENHRRYAELHGYPFFVDTKNIVEISREERRYDGEEGIMYMKLASLIKYIRMGIDTGNFHHVFYVDADTFITNPSVHLETLIPDPIPAKGDQPAKPQPGIMAGVDCEGPNAGVMMMSVEWWTLQFLVRSLAYRYRPKSCEIDVPSLQKHQDQSSMVAVAQEDDIAKARFVTLQLGDLNLMNSFPRFDDGHLACDWAGDRRSKQWKEGDFQIHLAGPKEKELWETYDTIGKEALLEAALIGDNETVSDRRMRAHIKEWWNHFA